ncbi:MAG TPA: TatD family hydrolase, partial [Spirochaetota bacterium]|nr:TatD family hydrolase [Spirochaetota bacterium]HQG43751.1 TatD family hydrolase [Spirochaetota bacterium]
MFIDSHAHFDLCAEDHKTSAETIISLMEENNVTTAVHIVIDTTGIQWGLDFINRHTDKNIYLAIGIHPSSLADSEALHQLSV